MSKPLPPLNWFRAFEAAARHLSFTAAAEEIGLTQSAVSQQIKALETRLRVALFIRQARGIALTDDGRRLLPQVGTALDTLASATARFETGPQEQLLTIAASVSITQWVIAPHLPAFVRANPGIRMRFLSAIWPDDFHAALADVEIRFGSEKQVGRNALALAPNRLVALKAPALAGNLDAFPLIEPVGTSDGWRAFGECHDCALPEPSIFADSYGMALHLAAHGSGVALASALLARHALETGLLVPAHPGSIPAKEGYYLSTRQDSGPAAVFRDWLLSLLAG